MARLNPTENAHIYDLHRRWITDVLDEGGSLLDASSIWTEETVEELVDCFIGQPDETPGKSFRDKLKDQLGDASPAAVQLMAEMHIVHFLHIWTGAITAATKQAQIEMVLSWMPRPPQLPADVVHALGPGLIHPGQFALTRRDVQLAWIIQFTEAWLGQHPTRRAELLKTPWGFREFCGSVGGESADNARLAMAHMTHPDTFEAIVSRNHKGMIAKRFAELSDGETDLDRQLLAIRQNLERDMGTTANFYDDTDLMLRWSKDSKRWKAFMRWARRYRELPEFEEGERTYKLALAAKLADVRASCIAGDAAWADRLRSVIRAGDNNLTSWRAHSKFVDWLDKDTESSREALLALWASDRPAPERFANFVDQVPHEVLGTVGERINIGSVLLMAHAPEFHPPLKISVLRKTWRLLGWPSDHDDELRDREVYERALLLFEEITHESATWDVPLRDPLDAQGATWCVLSWARRQDQFSDDEWDELVEYRGSKGEDDDEDDDGSGAQPGPKDLEATDLLARAARDLCVAREVLDDIVELLDDKGQVVLYGPPGTGKTFLALRLARAVAGDEERVSIVQFHPATTYEDFIEGLRPRLTDEGQLAYELVSGPLVRIAEQARESPDSKHVLVIDEINRANLPKVLGELLLLLEHRSEQAQLIHRPAAPFSLPRNLWIIGTMNTADRSVALIDAAMRRRFHFVPFFPHMGPMRELLRTWLERHGGRAGVAPFLDAINDALLETVGDHLLIGPSHFMKADLSDHALERIWEHNVFPLLEELFWGDRDTIQQWRWHEVRRTYAAELDGSADPESEQIDSGPSATSDSPSPLPRATEDSALNDAP